VGKQKRTNVGKRKENYIRRGLTRINQGQRRGFEWEEAGYLSLGALIGKRNELRRGRKKQNGRKNEGGPETDGGTNKKNLDQHNPNYTDNRQKANGRRIARSGSSKGVPSQRGHGGRM